MEIKIVEEIEEVNGDLDLEKEAPNGDLQNNLVKVLNKQNKLLKMLLFIAVVFGVMSFTASMYAFSAVQGSLQDFRSDSSQQILSVVKTLGGAMPGRQQQFTDPVNIVLPETAPYLGNKDSKVTVVEYADFQCPFCEKFFVDIFPKLKSDYIDTGKVKFSFQNFAFLGDESRQAGEAALCAKDQDKFWEYHDSLYRNQKGENLGAFSDLNLVKFAKTLGLDTFKFKECLNSNIYGAEVETQTTKGRDYGVSGTPTTFVNGKPIVGAQSYEQFKTVIEAELAK